MSVWVVVALALLTYGSRATAMAFLPPPSGRMEEVLARIPAPLFAGLAVLSLVTEDQTLADAPVLGAAAGGLLLAPFRSLPLTLAGGVAGYVVTTLIV
ncbi:MAG: AzlD domain-containing protein [Actinomycetota bacterium]